MEKIMDLGLIENEQTALSPTYSVLTAESILTWFDIHLEQDELMAVMQNPKSVYFQILQIPFKNIFNGIIFQQAYDYQVYAQKLFVDYLVSGNGNENAESQGASTREDLDSIRIKLIELSESFDGDTLAHKTLINQSQGHLRTLINDLQPIQDTEQNAQIIEQSMSPFRDRAMDISQVLRNDRIQFKTVILEALRLIQLLPDYREDPEQDAENRSTLQFDDELG